MTQRQQKKLLFGYYGFFYPSLAMRTYIRSAFHALLLVLLASCGGEGHQQQRNPAFAGSMNAPAGTTDAAYERLVQQLYVGYFGRPADPAGLAFYVNAYRAANAPTNVAGLFDAYSKNPVIRGLVDTFATSEESKQLYPDCQGQWIGCANQSVFALYDSLFSHEPDPEGALFWMAALTSGHTTRTNVLLSVMAGAQGTDAELIARKVEVATRFTRGLDAAGQRHLYDGHIANSIVRAMLQSVPGLVDDEAVQASIDATMERLANMASGAGVEVEAGTRKLVLLASPERLADNGARLTALALSLASDLSQLRPYSPTWQVTVVEAAASVSAIRDQLRGYDGAILIGHIPVPAARGAPFLDVYRLPDCPAFKMDDTGEVLNSLDLHSADPRCQNGLIISVLRGVTRVSESTELAAKLDQMIAYHRASAEANAGWLPRFRFIQAGWFGGRFSWGDLSPLWSGINLYPANAITYQETGTAAERLNAFLECIGSNSEMCAVSVHGAPQTLSFEGPGVAGEFYSNDSISWVGFDLAAQSVKAKYIELVSCSTQNFLHELSVGSSLLMRGDALLTRGTVEVTFVGSHYEEDIIKNEYAMLQLGSTFAESLYGRMEGSPVSIQGDPFITMRRPPSGPQPRLLIDGKHYNGGAMTLPVLMPDANAGASTQRVVTFANGGNADLRVRIGSMFAVTGVDYGTPQGGEWEWGYNAQYETEFKQVFSDGRVVLHPDFTLEQNGGAMPVTLKPGESVAITYKLSVRTGADGKPKRPGLYTGQVTVTSNDPASARIYFAMQGRVR